MAKKLKCDYLDKLGRILTREYGKDKSDAIMKRAWQRYRELISENSDEPKVVRMHTWDRIYPGIAAFDAMTAEGIGREETAEFLIKYYRWRSKKMAKIIKRLMKLPGLYKKIPAIFTSLTKRMFGEASGFEARYYEVSKSEMRVDMLKCPYYDNCKKYGCPEIVAGYCEADDVCYGDMHPKLKWGRTKTIGKGGDCCDFRITLETHS